jgi:hypothetical protein
MAEDGCIDNLSRDSRSISRDVCVVPSVVDIPEYQSYFSCASTVLLRVLHFSLSQKHYCACVGSSRLKANLIPVPEPKIERSADDNKRHKNTKLTSTLSAHKSGDYILFIYSFIIFH